MQIQFCEEYWRQVKISASKQNRQLDVTSDLLECLPLRSEHEYHNMDGKIFCESGDSSKEVPKYVLDVTECLLAFCSVSSVYKVEKLI